MRLFVTVKTRAREESVETIDPSHFTVSVKAQPIEGKVNAAVRRLLAQYLGVPRVTLVLRSGVNGKKKVFDYETA
ncbi:MAG: DUF167 domain-containing protein [Candidatus Moraniibacteriota bacterium]